MELNTAQIRQLMKMTTEDLAEMTLLMAERHPDTFVSLMGSTAKRKFTIPYSGGQVVEFTREEQREIRNFKYADQKLNCVKKVREISKLGLKEAKDLVEGVEFMKFLDTGV